MLPDKEQGTTESKIKSDTEYFLLLFLNKITCIMFSEPWWRVSFSSTFYNPVQRSTFVFQDNHWLQTALFNRTSLMGQGMKATELLFQQASIFLWSICKSWTENFSDSIGTKLKMVFLPYLCQERNRQVQYPLPSHFHIKTPWPWGRRPLALP